MDSFSDMSLKKEIEMGLLEYGFDKPTLVQERAIPQALLGKDIVARAKNGTGKTASFVIPILQQIDTSLNEIQAVVLVPVRELTLQIAEVFYKIGKFLNIEVMSCSGGLAVNDDLIRLNKTVHIIVSTPGRLKDLIMGKGNAKINHVRHVVLDEADKLLDVDYDSTVYDLVKEFRNLQDRPQFMLTSASFPESVKDFCNKYMNKNNLEEIHPYSELTLEGVSQYYAYINENIKVKMLHHLFKKLNINQSIIFCKSKDRVELLTRNLQSTGLDCLYIHSDMNQKERNKVFHDFREGHCRNLVSTDVFNRGIDNQNVNVVINFDFPRRHEDYLHRIGRSGRYGHLGIAINFVTDSNLNDYHKIVDRLDATILKVPSDGIIDEKLYCS
eukprot:CAMPEP_0117419286 /NCGR_PEP_ID=MMETSP0758-20121206/882_1 /TAXON_ID=63605 /ORGANISM="Percolomonas cosmopolitus, Strain AE-1 (ATCC 50343)" /LENGTH=384 /DNA_ID=CAMNT_0005200267 /DNA_START=198 /DNA_END=1352 /DNA_ORIENTATION=+